MSLIWPLSLILCVLCMAGLVVLAITEDKPEKESPRGYYPAWLQNAIAHSQDSFLDQLGEKKNAPAEHERK